MKLKDCDNAVLNKDGEIYFYYKKVRNKNRCLCLKKPIFVKVNIESCGMFFLEYEEYNLFAHGESLTQTRFMIEEELFFLWDEYAMAEDILTSSAMKFREKLLKDFYIEES